MHDSLQNTVSEPRSNRQLPLAAIRAKVVVGNADG